MKKKAHGLTLVELMVTLAVLALLTTIAVPAYQNVVRSNRLVTSTNTLSRDISLARSEALKRGTNVTICSSANPTAPLPACKGTLAAGDPNWATGWIVFQDTAMAGAVATATDVINVEGPLPPGLTLTGNLFTNSGILMFKPDGTLRDTTSLFALVNANTGTFQVCDTNADAFQLQRARALNVSPMGRVAVASDTGSDRIVNDINDANVTCP